MKEYKLAVFIGRFQPIHKSHVEAIKQALEVADNVLIIVGSSYCAPNTKNPFSFTTRKVLIREAFEREDNIRISIEPVRDYFYSENTWVTDVQNIVKFEQFAIDASDEETVLMGNYKDSSSYYLKLFPQWEFRAIKNIKVLNSTDVRELLFNPDNLIQYRGWSDKLTGESYDCKYEDLKKLLPEGVFAYLNRTFIRTQEHSELVKEYEHLANYKKKWESSPFPPTFVTSDSVVVKSGHILLVKRKFAPGKGLYALPGGFVKQNESIRTGAIRELKEETRIKLHKQLLDDKIKDMKIFDYPGRSLRGRTITHAFYIDLGSGELPEVKGSDDASGAFWMPLSNLGREEEKFFEDHLTIIRSFVGG